MKSRIFLFLSLVMTAALLPAGCAKHESRTVSASPAAGAENSFENTDPQIERAKLLIEKAPESVTGYNSLAAAYIQSARETGDFGLNEKAELAVRRALEIEPENATAQKLRASLHLTFHRFQEALEEGQKLRKLYPRDAFVYGVLTDAYVELGNYEAAVEAAQSMVDLKPNMESYARVAHVRSLHGDADGAIETMAAAARIADPGNREVRSWCLANLGEEYFKIGKYGEAERQFDAALQILPNYAPAFAGKAKARAGLGDYETAVKLYSDSINLAPTADAAVALGNLYTKKNDPEQAARQYELAEVLEQKFGNSDQRLLALLWSDRGVRLDEALRIAERERARRNDIYTADVYAWALFKNGKYSEAQAAIKEAMRLKTKDAQIFYHAGMIEKAMGNKREARRLLNLALEINPAFDLLQSEAARRTLEEIKQ